MRTNLTILSLLLLVSPVTILTTLLLVTPPTYVRGNPGINLRIDRSTPYHIGDVLIAEYWTNPGDFGDHVELYIQRSSGGPYIWITGSMAITAGVHRTQSVDLGSTMTPFSPGSYIIGAKLYVGSSYLGNAEVSFQIAGAPTSYYTVTPPPIIIFPTFTTSTTAHTGPPPGPSFDFSIALSPSILTVTQGGVANYPIFITYSNPVYMGTSVSVQVAGLGPGMNYQVVTSPPGLMISTSPSTPTGTYNIILTGSVMGVMHQTSAVLMVQAAQQQTTQQSFDFSLLVSPGQQSVAPGGSTSFMVTVGLVSGDPTRAMVELSVSGTPSGVSASFNPPYGTVTFTSTLTVATTSSVAPGSFTLTVTGRWWIAQTGETRTHTAQALLTISQSPQTSMQVAPSQTQPQTQPQTVSTQTSKTGLGDMLQQNSVIIIVALIIVLIAAVIMKGRKPAPIPAPSSQPSPSGVFCAKCGNQNPPGNEFCLNCGEKLRNN